MMPEELVTLTRIGAGSVVRPVDAELRARARMTVESYYRLKEAHRAGVLGRWNRSLRDTPRQVEALESARRLEVRLQP